MATARPRVRPEARRSDDCPISPVELAAALPQANLPTLLLSLAQLTGDDRWLKDPYRPTRARGLSDNDDGGFAPDVQREIRKAALELLRAWRDGDLVPAPAPGPDRVAEMLSISLGMEVPRAYGPVMSEEMGLISRDVPIATPPGAHVPSVTIIGAGFSGLGLAAKLTEAGIPFEMIEKNDSVGGTWLENTYPGAGVDTPSHLYSFSFYPSNHWSRYFSKGPELHDYLERVADEFGIREHIRFGSEVVAAAYEEVGQAWTLQVRNRDGVTETRRTDVLVSAVGVLNRPSVPPIEGLETFEGPSMHTARWRDDVELGGKRVAVIGTGASAMQLVPVIAGEPEQLLVFQRSPQWAVPHPNYLRSVPDAVKLVMDEMPFYAAWYRARLLWNNGDRLQPSLQIDPHWSHPERSINAENEKHRQFLTRYIAEQLGDRADELMGRCLPAYPPYGKRMLLDNGWFRTATRDDVTLIADDVVEVRPHSLRTANGDEYEVDVLILATGFRTLQMLWPMDVRGRAGTTLRETWGDDDARANLGMTVPGFPNFFCLFGPNTLSGHGGSHVYSVELQVRYVMKLLGAMIEQDLGSIECRLDAYEAYNERLDDALSHTVWTHPGMTTYYRNSKGRIVVNIPWKNVDYWAFTREPDLAEFVAEPRYRPDADSRAHR